jgi:hypothetical protein
VWLRDLPPLCRDCAESDRAGRHPDHPHCGAAFHRAPGRRSPGSWPRGYRWARMSASLTTRRCRPRSCENALHHLVSIRTPGAIVPLPYEYRARV